MIVSKPPWYHTAYKPVSVHSKVEVFAVIICVDRAEPSIIMSFYRLICVNDSRIYDFICQVSFCE